MDKPSMILFDYGGTLLYEPGADFLNGEREVFRHVVRNPRNLTPEELSRFEGSLYASNGACRELGYEAHEMQMLRMKYEYNEIELDISYEEAERILWSHTSPMTEKALTPYVRQMLSFLKAEGIRTGVISNIGWSGKALRERIDRLLPDHAFEFIIASSEYGIRKPNPMLFELALRKAGLSASEVWYCGDTFEMDVEGAHRAGIFPVYYVEVLENGPERTPAGKRADYPYLTIGSWRELIGHIGGGKSIYMS